MTDNQKNILVIEDDRYAANLYKLKLAKEGYKIEIANDGEEALDKVEKFNPDLIVLDLLLPGMDGFTVLKTLRQGKELKTPILVLSNLGEDENVEKALGLGADDYMIKVETGMEELAVKIESLIK